MPSTSLLYLNEPQLSFLKKTRTYLSSPYIPILFDSLYVSTLICSLLRNANINDVKIF